LALLAAPPTANAAGLDRTQWVIDGWLLCLALPLGWLYGALAELGNRSLGWFANGKYMPGFATCLASVLAFNAYYIYPAVFFGEGFGDIAVSLERWHHGTSPVFQ